MFFYTTPIDYLLLTLSEDGLIMRAAFDSQKGRAEELSLPSLTHALDSYFIRGVPLPYHFHKKDIPGTVFQKKVWQIIDAIPYGEVLTYKDIAMRLGDSHLSRAVGTACGKNPIALFIPCHRVVRVSGEDFSYSWGRERKKWLLLHEGYGK
jgi:O-6-methylguanine DNA methyltransferase